MKLSEWAQNILYSEDLEAKLLLPTITDFDAKTLDQLPDFPLRSPKIKFSENQIKFPKSINLNQPLYKAQALNSFANHELLAIEMMCCALLQFPERNEEDKRFKKGIVNTIKDEQKHFKLYRARMNQLGYDFGDFPLNDFFWRQMKKIKSPESFVAVMSLTFEAANLDFALHYKKIFESFQDIETANVLNIVYQDEISHVAFGATYANLWKKDKSLWEYYLSVLPFPLTPARSKGISYNSDSRLIAGMGQEFINSLNQYQDPFRVTRRRKSHE